MAGNEDKEISEDQICGEAQKGLDFYTVVIGSHQKFLRKSDIIRFTIQKDFSS